MRLYSIEKWSIACEIHLDFFGKIVIYPLGFIRKDNSLLCISIRVEKTFLVNEFSQNRYAFKHTAALPLNDKLKPKFNLLKIQLNEFHYSLRSYGLKGMMPIPADWSGAFYILQELLNGVRYMTDKELSEMLKVSRHTL